MGIGVLCIAYDINSMHDIEYFTRFAVSLSRNHS